MITNAIPRFVWIALLAIFASSSARAENWLEQIRSADLNDYALGLAVSTGQNPYRGAESSTFFYPYLTSFKDSAMTQDWLLIREGNVGGRIVLDNDWEFGVLGRVNTLGLGNTVAPELSGLRERNWTLEAAPMVGYRGWPVHVNFKSFAEVLGRHSGLTHNLSLTWPMQFSRGYLVPGIEQVWTDSEYNDYYFDVHADEVTATRPAYATGASMSTHLKLRWGYALTDRWLLAGTLRVEALDDAVEDSPIVGRSHVWSANVGLAYNANMFRPRDAKSRSSQRFELRVGAFHDTVDSKIRYGSPTGVAGREIDIEDDLDVSDEETLFQVEGIYRLNHYHRLEFSYMQLHRDGLATLDQPISFGGSDYPAGTIVDSTLKNEIARFSYGYSILRDDQKELGVSAGVHFTGIEAEITSLTTGQTQKASSSTPLPVIGVFASVDLSDAFTVGMKAQFFRMDFDRYEGSVNAITAYAERELRAGFLIGLAYNYFSLNLKSSDPEVAGSVTAKHSGPAVYLSLRI